MIPSTITLNLTVSFSAETLAAVNGLSAALSTAGVTSAPAASTAAVKAGDAGKVVDSSKGGEGGGSVTIYWFDSAAGTVGTVDSEDAFKALKKKQPKLVKWTKEKYEAKLAEIEAAKSGGSDDDDIPTEQDLIDAFGAYLDPSLDEDEKKERRAFVGPMVKRFGAKKASEIPEEHRKLALNLLARKEAGEDVDPENDDYQEIEEGSLV